MFVSVHDETGTLGVFKLAAPLRVGRDATNDIVLPLEQVSRRHALVWVADGKLWFQDLGSSNGSFLEGKRMASEPVQLAHDQVIGLGGVAELRFRGKPDEGTDLLLQVGRLRFPLLPGETRLGPNSDRQIPGLEQEALVIHEEEVWLEMGEQRVRLTPGIPTELGGQSWRVLPVGTARETVTMEDVWPYELQVWTDAPAGIEVQIRDLRSDKVWRSANNPAVLVYLLATGWSEGSSGPTKGWLDDQELLIGVWGRKGLNRDLNVLHALLHRVRRGLRKEGLDPDCLQKRRGLTRMAVQSVVVR
ncbi:MAG: FHA domain-containing protein [Myxococcota bacterium]|nr:FHA domain-containing protein [Myxococcota bacterium]